MYFRKKNLKQLKSRVLEIPIGISQAMTNENLTERQVHLQNSYQILSELETLFIIANKLNFISDEDVDIFNTKSQTIGMHINGLMQKFKLPVTTNN